MYGFLNVFMAATLVYAGESDDTALAVLQEEDPLAFSFSDDAIVWRDKRIDADQIQAARADFAISFGSCSFREPVDEIESLAHAVTTKESVNHTHDPALTSWVESANSPDTDFPIQNLPFGVFSRKGETERRVGVAIGDQIVDIGESLSANLWTGKARDVARFCDRPTMKELMQAPKEALSEFRSRLSELLSGTPGDESAINPLPPGALVPMSEAEMRPPTEIGDYTDFYASIYHATNVGKLFRPESPLLPNYKYVPIGYHGRASSIVLSGTEVRRPKGQILSNGSKTPTFGPSQMLDYEAEVGFFVGQGNALGEPVSIDEAEDHIFGICIVNDWSARDIQSWEYQPLGPFLSKNFATSISPWVVTWEAFGAISEPRRSFARRAIRSLFLISLRKRTRTKAE